MKARLTLLILAVTLLTGCYHSGYYTKIILVKTSKPDASYFAEFTNTSSSKYLEVTIKYEYSNSRDKTRIIKLKPGEIYSSVESYDDAYRWYNYWYIYKGDKVSVVGEREINHNY